MTRSAKAEFDNVLGMAGSQKKAQAQRLLDHVQFVPDNHSTRTANRQITKKGRRE